MLIVCSALLQYKGKASISYKQTIFSPLFVVRLVTVWLLGF